MKRWSKFWKSSKQPRKQRKYRYNAPFHAKRNLLSAHLSKDLRKKYGKRSFPVRKGDEVEIMRGDFKKKKGKISRVNIKTAKVYVDGVTIKKVEGTEVAVPLDPSNLRVTDLELKDKRRVEALNRKEEKNVASKKDTGPKVLEGKKKADKVDSKPKARAARKK
ncbi:50S ribosomal protein L24 [Candidatus Micrarchaeota archaeon RBG_16_49_10]|nr:50S ribosomal protein L24, large subunit ribosomal protein L24 [uncultured archaeon]OGI15372.1 MAG: 50S ribosomal protein L24 [Candidatus Micrarchaeota archaeon RBG_16_49_10]